VISVAVPNATDLSRISHQRCSPVPHPTLHSRLLKALKERCYNSPGRWRGWTGAGRRQWPRRADGPSPRRRATGRRRVAPVRFDCLRRDQTSASSDSGELSRAVESSRRAHQSLDELAPSDLRNREIRMQIAPPKNPPAAKCALKSDKEVVRSPAFRRQERVSRAQYFRHADAHRAVLGSTACDELRRGELTEVRPA
jgi:hypothetical protein